MVWEAQSLSPRLAHESPCCSLTPSQKFPRRCLNETPSEETAPGTSNFLQHLAPSYSISTVRDDDDVTEHIPPRPTATTTATTKPVQRSQSAARDVDPNPQQAAGSSSFEQRRRKLSPEAKRQNRGPNEGLAQIPNLTE